MKIRDGLFCLSLEIGTSSRELVQYLHIGEEEMFHILKESQENLIGIRVVGKLTAQDYAVLLPFIESLIKQHGSIRILSDLQDYQGIEFGAIIKSLPYSFKCRNRVEKKAVITQSKSMETWVKRLSPFFKTKVKCFLPSQMNEAWDWVKN